MCHEPRQLMGGVRGWRGKLGHMTPSVERLSIAREIIEVLPEGVEILSLTLGMTSDADEQAQHALSQVEDAAKRLGLLGAQFVSVGGTPLVTIRGYGSDIDIIKRVEALSKCPATTSLTAVIAAFQALQVSKVIHISLIPDEVNRRIREFLASNGLEVINIRSLNLPTTRVISELPVSTGYHLAKEAYLQCPQAQGILMTGPVTPRVIACLEEDLGKPVVSSHQACIWQGLRTIKVKEPVRGYGRLFDA